MTNLWFVNEDHPAACLRTVPQFSMVVPLRSQARLWHSLLHWAYFGLFRAQRAAFVRPAYGGPVFRRCALRVLAPPALRASNGQRPGRECIFPFRTALRFACAVFRACALRVLGTSALRAFTFLQAFASTVRNRRSASLASSLAALVAHWAHFGLFPPQAAASVRPAKNARNDVHAVISD